MRPRELVVVVETDHGVGFLWNNGGRMFESGVWVYYSIRQRCASHVVCSLAQGKLTHS